MGALIMTGEYHEVVPWFMRGNKQIQTLVVAEIGNNHDGSLGNLIHMIDLAVLHGADCVKIQLHMAEHESTDKEQFPKRFNYHPQDKTRKDYWKRMSFTGYDLHEIRNVCDDRNIKLIVSVFCVQAVAYVMHYFPNLWAFKIPSGETDNRDLIEAIRQTGKRTILSTGMSDTREVNTNVCHLLKQDGPIEELYVLQCTTDYPCPVELVGVNVCEVYSRNFIFKGGLSDHSGLIYPGIIAAYLGAEMVEVHVCYHRNQFGADIPSSLTFADFERLTQGVAYANQLRMNPVNKDLYVPSVDANCYREGKQR